MAHNKIFIQNEVPLQHFILDTFIAKEKQNKMFDNHNFKWTQKQVFADNYKIKSKLLCSQFDFVPKKQVLPQYSILSTFYLSFE